MKRRHPAAQYVIDADAHLLGLPYGPFPGGPGAHWVRVGRTFDGPLHLDSGGDCFGAAESWVGARKTKRSGEPNPGRARHSMGPRRLRVRAGDNSSQATEKAGAREPVCVGRQRREDQLKHETEGYG